MKAAWNNPERLLDFLSSERKRLSPLLVLTHDYPDPDSMASAAALRYLAEKQFRIKARIAYGGIIGRDENSKMVRTLKLPVQKYRPDDLKRFAGFALVDTQPAFGNNPFPEVRKPSLIIDQHPSVRQPVADFVLVDPTAGATSILLAEALLHSGIDIPRNLATALVYGILTDTMNFLRDRRQRIITTYLSLLPLSDIGSLAHIQYPSRPRSFFTQFARAMEDAVIHRRLIVTHLGEVRSPDQISAMAEFLLTCKGMLWSFCTGRIGGNLHFSLRTANARGRADIILRSILGESDQAGGRGNVAAGKTIIGSDKHESEWLINEYSLTRRLVKRLRMGGSENMRWLVHDGKRREPGA